LHAVVRLTYAVRAIQTGEPVAHRRVRLREAGAPASPPPPPAPTASLTIGPQSLAYSGGTVTVTYSSSNATRCSLSATPTLWSGANPLSVACDGTTTLEVPATVSERQWTITFTATGATGRSATATGTLTQEAKPFLESPNWSGYVLPSSGIVTAVSGTFTVPTLDCSQTPTAGVATWVGIGGAGGSTGDLLQTGVESDCVDGVQADDPAWWELVPPYPAVDFTSMSVSPGDQVEASVYESGTYWVTRLDDLTTGISGVMISGDLYGTIQDSNPGVWLAVEGSAAAIAYSGGTTAEWIVEDYELSSGSLVPFADYGTVTFSNLGTSVPSWSLASADPVEIVQNGSVLSVPSAPSGDGFSVSYTG